jgi:hypothetical protein
VKYIAATQNIATAMQLCALAAGDVALCDGGGQSGDPLVFCGADPSYLILRLQDEKI